MTTARYFSSCPSDSTSRWTPCPPELRERWLQVRLGCLQLSPSCPFRLFHTFCSLRPARRYPRLWIRRPSFERRRDFNPPDLCAARRTLRASPPPHPARPVPRGSPVGGHAPPPDGASRVASDSRVHACWRHYPGGTAGCCRSSRPAAAAFPIRKPGRPPHYPFRGLLSVHSRSGLRARQTTQGGPIRRLR